MARSFKQRGTVVVPLAESPIPMVEVESIDNPAIFSETIAGEGNITGLIMYGKSTQVTTTGAQLFDKSAVTPNQWLTDAGKVEGIRGFSNSDYIPVSPGTYAGTRKGSARTAFYNTEKVFVRYLPWDGGSLTVNEGEAFVRFTILTGSEDKYIDNLMFNAGSTAKPWEPYTGGKPSPSQEYPQPIVSTGDGGSIGLNLTGRNLIVPDPESQDGIECVYENGLFHCTGKASYTMCIKLGTCRLFAGIQYFLFGGIDSTNTIIASKTPSSFEIMDTGQGALYTSTENTEMTVYFRVENGQTINLTVKPQLEVGSTATPYEPYKSQSLTISTPNGLPGIPVDSGGNYTDASGQQWVCDVKDYGTGKYTQMVGHIESYNGENITTPYMSTTGQLSTGAEVYYVLDEPVVTDISADELTAYRALQTYDGTTVISVNSDPIAPGVKTTVKVIDPNSGNPQIMQLWLDEEGHPVNINGRGARVGGTPTQQYILQPCSF